jgi:beta-lactamase superfamily II metal-dependent hydrolase
MKLSQVGRSRFFPFAVFCALSLASAGAVLAGLEIVGIDVGQGDCTLIISPTGKTVLIDAGYTGQGTGTVIPYLRSRGITGLDYTVASHYHIDHIGGLDEVINTLGRDSIRVACYDRGWNYTTAAYTQYVNATGSKRQTMTEYQVIDLGGGATLTCLGLNSMGVLTSPYGDGRYDDNNLCIAVLLDYGSFEMVLSGDVPGQKSGDYYNIEAVLAGRVGDVDVYKVDHHGSATSSQTTLLNAALPEVSLIYVGDGNSYGHPTQVVIDRLVAVDSYIYQTELGAGGTIPSGHGEVVNGHIIINVGESSYTVGGDTYSLGTSGVPVVAGPVFFTASPNPFVEGTVLRFSFGERPAEGGVAVGIFDVAGRLVNVYPLAPSEGGGALRWDGRGRDGGDVPPGVYFVRISGSSRSATHKIVKR